MLKTLLRTTLLAGVFIASIPTFARAADVSVTLSLFHDRLAPYGEWVSVNRYGSCWRPTHIARAWRPYTVGHWVYTDYGWTWVSDESWGWATYHYGRWIDDPDYGWIWIPDQTWGPAYVAWRYGDGWIGWAPLPPGVSLGVTIDIDRYVRPSAYSFVQAQYFPDPGIRTHIVADTRNVSLIPVTRNVTRYDAGGGRIVDRGVDPREVERASGRHIAQLQVRDSADPRAPRARVANNALMVYRPSPASREAGRPTAQPRAERQPAPPQARPSEAPNRARGTTGRVVPGPSRVEQPQRRSAQPQSRQRTAQPSRTQAPQPPRAEQSRQRPQPPRAAQQPRPSQQRQRAAPQQQPQQQRRAQPQVNQRPSNRSAAPRPNQPPNNNGKQEKGKKKKGGG